MYKVIIQTTDTLSPSKSPLHSVVNLKLEQPLQNPPQQLISVSMGQVFRQLQGRIHLMRNLISSQSLLNSHLNTKLNANTINSMNPSANQNQKPKIKLLQKSRALLLISPSKQTINMLEEKLMQIQTMYKVSQNCQVTLNQMRRNLHIVIIFKSIAIAEQIYAYLKSYKIAENAVFYTENVCVAIVDKLGFLESWKEMLVDQQTGKQIWAEIPHCLRCLDTLESQITGIQSKTLAKLDKSAQAQSCIVCIIRQKQQSQCSECSQIQDNWVCMVCGVIGCGRYKNADAYKHYISSKHILSLDLKTHRIWNYKLDCFSHRMIRQDGALQYQQQQNEQLQNQQIQLQFWKYCNVVSEQLDRQRNFYEKIKQQQIDRYGQEQKILQNKLNQIEKIKEEKRQNLKKKQKKNKKLQKRFIQLQQQCKQERQLSKYLQQSVKTFNINSKKEGISTKQSQLIIKKKLQLQKIQQQIQQYLLSLTAD